MFIWEPSVCLISYKTFLDFLCQYVSIIGQYNSKVVTQVRHFKEKHTTAQLVLSYVDLDKDSKEKIRELQIFRTFLCKIGILLIVAYKYWLYSITQLPVEFQ